MPNPSVPLQNFRVQRPGPSHPGHELRMILIRIVRIRVNKNPKKNQDSKFLTRSHAHAVCIGEDHRSTTHEHGPRLTVNHEKNAPVWCGVNVFTSNIAVGCGPVEEKWGDSSAGYFGFFSGVLTNRPIPELVDSKLQEKANEHVQSVQHFCR